MFDVDAALDHLTRIRPAEAAVPAGVPPEEIHRSPAAAVVGDLAHRDGLFLAHFEHRAPWPEPEASQPWQNGVLPEDKYGSFRHELPIGSFHPAHRAKWGAHELCHGLVRSAWSPTMSPLGSATSARLAELVPVVLWYFLDEIGSRRCPLHEGPLFRTFCRCCDAAATAGSAPIDPDRARRHLDDAWRFLDGELAAIARSRRLGRPVPHVWGSLDLCSDGLAYQQAHGPDLASRAFGVWAETFGAGWPSLEALEARVIAVSLALTEGRDLAPQPGGAARWVAMDLGARLLDVWGDTDGSCAIDLLGMVRRLADGVPPADVYADYVALSADHVLPDPRILFAVGYPVAGVDSLAVGRIAEGLASVVSSTLELYADADLDPVPAFVAADGPSRRPLGERFAAWLTATEGGPVAELARFEAALGSAAGEPVAAILGDDGEGLRLVDGARVLRFDFDPVAFAHAVEVGKIEGRAVAGALSVSAPDREPTALVIARDASGEVMLVDVSVDAAAALDEDASGLPPEVSDALARLGLVVPRRWRLG